MKVRTSLIPNTLSTPYRHIETDDQTTGGGRIARLLLSTPYRHIINTLKPYLSHYHVQVKARTSLIPNTLSTH